MGACVGGYRVSLVMEMKAYEMTLSYNTSIFSLVRGHFQITATLALTIIFNAACAS